MSNRTAHLRGLAEDKLIALMEQPDMNDGEFARAQFFCRVVEAETNGGAYGVTTYINGANREAILAKAAGAVVS